MFTTETFKRKFEIVVSLGNGFFEWDLYYSRGKGFAVYLMAFGKAETQEEALEVGREIADKLYQKMRYS